MAGDEGCGTCYQNDAEKGDNAGNLFRAGEGFVDYDAAGPAGDDGGKEGYYCYVGEGEVLQGVFIISYQRL